MVPSAVAAKTPTPEEPAGGQSARVSKRRVLNPHKHPDNFHLLLRSQDTYPFLFLLVCPSASHSTRPRPPLAKMWSLRAPTLLLLAALLSLASTTSLTYKFHSKEKACFYAWADKPSSKIAFYFAVRPHLPRSRSPAAARSRFTHTTPLTPLQVQSGGAFDIDYAVTGPHEKSILDGTKERQGDFVFTATEAGEYRFCFDNEMSSVTDKVVDFEISVRPPLPLSRAYRPTAHTPHPGRERSPRQPARQAGRPARADQPAVRVYLQAQRPAVHDHAPAKVLPHAREPQF